MEAKEGKTSTREKYEALAQQLTSKQEEAQNQGNVVRQLKNDKAEKAEISAAVEKLKKIKKEVEKLTQQWRSADPSKLHIDRRAFEQAMLGRCFIVPSFEIYQGVAGLYDLGPPACAVKNNLLSLWRQFFVLEDNLLEVDSSCLTPSIVFKHSGHEKRFFDYMVKDEKTGTPHRADKLVEEFLETQLSDVQLSSELREQYTNILNTLDNLGQDQLNDTIRKFNISSPEGNEVSDIFPFNLMFPTQIGPVGDNRGFLRPETAQGIFVNFRRLLDYNGKRMPFGAATVGQAFRNEIAPRAGLLRVREFSLAEIEFFRNPDDDTCAKYEDYKDVQVRLLSRENQTAGHTDEAMTIHEAHEKGLICNQYIGYYVARIYLFLRECGIMEEGLRFRQHLMKEMAHYATDCWDAEILTSYGWIECVGCADRACFDLTAHEQGANVELKAYEMFDEPKYEDAIECKRNKRAIGKNFKKLAGKVNAHLDYLEKHLEEARVAKKQMEQDGKYKFTTEDNTELELSNDQVEIKEYKKKIPGRHYTPSVVEPSFGIGRILYSILEHAYWVRQGDKNDEKQARAVLSLSPSVAPYKCSVLPLSVEKEFNPFIKRLAQGLTSRNISHKVDAGSQSIGRRYARTDELGIPFAITVDFDSVKDNTVTLRERDSCTQIRAPMEEVIAVIDDLLSQQKNWQQVRDEYPEQKESASAEVGKK
eukprot:gb/GECH01013886.1/.p1 GENE.gb/GECH01013886.1/~~gb/GECH01013886.1/.p1  ORF type:complete len:703 (+),score=179.55 gb/GECH01013886.1/:1-2109(+)